MPALIEAAGLSKRFGKVKALRQPGPDPAQRSGRRRPWTERGQLQARLIRMVAFPAQADGGSLHVNGHDVVADAMAVRRLVRSRRPIGRRGGDGRHFAENLVMVARLYGREGEAQASLQHSRPRPGLGTCKAAADRLVRASSGGMRRATRVPEPAFFFFFLRVSHFTSCPHHSLAVYGRTD